MFQGEAIGMIREEVCEELDQMKEIYTQLPNFLSQVASDLIASKVPKALQSEPCLQSYGVQFIPQVHVL